MDGRGVFDGIELALRFDGVLDAGVFFHGNGFDPGHDASSLKGDRMWRPKKSKKRFAERPMCTADRRGGGNPGPQTAKRTTWAARAQHPPPPDGAEWDDDETQSQHV